MAEPNNIIILDTTLRDGEQTPGVSLNLDEKVAIARQLERLGVDYIEAGFPAASEGDFEAVRAVSQSVRCGVASFGRCLEGDIEKMWQAAKYSEKPRLHLFLATSGIHMRHKLKMEPEEVLRRAVEGVRLAKSLCADVQFSCEDASRSDIGFLREVLSAVIEAGANTVNLPDTVGYAMPDEYGAMFAEIIRTVPNIGRAAVSAHCHNDLGVAVANSLAAVKNGARQVETTVNGLGERAGNCALEELVMAITTRGPLYGVGHNINTTRIHRASQRVAALTGIPVPVCKAIVGANAFSHQSGIHQHGMLANPMTYQIMTPQSVGKAESSMVLGKLSGKHAFAEKLKELNFTLSDSETEKAFKSFKELADRKKDLADDDIEALVNSMMNIPEYYALESFQITSGRGILGMASVTLTHDGEAKSEAAVGDGPIDAAYSSIVKIVGGNWSLETYEIKAVTGGRDALGEVTVRVKNGNGIHVGKGLSTDIIESSILAYINAINRALAKRARMNHEPS